MEERATCECGRPLPKKGVDFENIIELVSDSFAITTRCSPIEYVCQCERVYRFRFGFWFCLEKRCDPPRPGHEMPWLGPEHCECGNCEEGDDFPTCTCGLPLPEGSDAPYQTTCKCGREWDVDPVEKMMQKRHRYPSYTTHEADWLGPEHCERDKRTVEVKEELQKGDAVTSDGEKWGDAKTYFPGDDGYDEAARRHNRYDPDPYQTGPDADVMRQLKRAFGVDPEHNSPVDDTDWYGIDLGLLTGWFCAKDDWAWEVRGVNDDANGQADSLTAAIDAAKDAARELLINDLNRL